MLNISIHVFWKLYLRARNGISLVDSDIWKLIDWKTKLIESQREFFASVSNSYVIIWNNWWCANCMDESNTGVYFFCLDHVFILIFIECLASRSSLFIILFFYLSFFRYRFEIKKCSPLILDSKKHRDFSIMGGSYLISHLWNTVSIVDSITPTSQIW